MKTITKIKYFINCIRWKVISLLIEIYVKLIKKRFYCRALKGDSCYNICINSDLTVSCNCNDNNGLGKIGNLRKQTLEQIFSGKKAKYFRESLAKGKLPIPNCTRCSDLLLIDKKIAKNFAANYTLPKKGIMIENTVNCNLNCLSCCREKILSLRDKRSMSLEDIKLISSIIKKNKIESISYFGLGEPFFSNRIKEELEIIRKDNPKIIITASTNGVSVDSKEKREAALLLDCIIFSIDGSTQRSVNRYQRGGNFNKTYSNMKSLLTLRNSLRKNKPTIIWKYILFRWNDSKELISNAIRLAKKAKIDGLYFELTTSPLFGISYKHYLRFGYLNKIVKRNGKVYYIDLNNNDVGKKK